MCPYQYPLFSLIFKLIFSLLSFNFCLFLIHHSYVLQNFVLSKVHSISSLLFTYLQVHYKSICLDSRRHVTKKEPHFGQDVRESRVDAFSKMSHDDDVMFHGKKPFLWCALLGASRPSDLHFNERARAFSRGFSPQPTRLPQRAIFTKHHTAKPHITVLILIRVVMSFGIHVETVQ